MLDKDGNVVEDKDKGGGDKDKDKDKEKTWTLDDGSGTPKVVTEAEMKEMATKAAGADEKFRVAAEKLKAAEAAGTSNAESTKIVNSFNNIKSGEFTKTDLREFGELVGLESGEIEKMFAEDLEKNNKSAGAKKDDIPIRKLKMEDFDAETQETLRGARKSQITDAEGQILDMVKKAVDKDKIFGTILEKTDEKQRANRKAAIVNMVSNDVNRKILRSKYSGEVFGDEMIKGSVQEIRANIEQYGIVDRTSKQPATGLLAALGLSGELQTKVQADEKIERVPVTDPAWLENVVARMAQDQRKNSEKA